MHIHTNHCICGLRNFKIQQLSLRHGTETAKKINTLCYHLNPIGGTSIQPLADIKKSL